MRRLLHLAAGASALALIAGSTTAQNLSTVKVAHAGSLSSPLDLTSPPGDPRLFVVEQNAADIEIIHPDSSQNKFLDLSGKTSTGGERGLLGLAFHPDYASNGRFFVAYTRNNGNVRIEEYAVDSTDPNLADPNQVQTIIVIPQPFSNHNGGCIKFGSDGMLYVGTGDGGSGNDPGNRAQDGQELLGKMLRFDVDIPSPFIPNDNPFVGDPNVRDEIWALGLRNPWRFSFDRATGDLWIGDVGQNAREEVHWAPGTSAGAENYGWRCMEGFNCTGLSGCTCNDPILEDPVHDYSHGFGCSITGGYAYRGPIAGIQGTYFFGDYCSGRIWSFDWDGSSMSNFTERTAELDPPGGDSINRISSFGEDADGNLYIVDIQDGQIFMVVGDCNTPTYCEGPANGNEGDLAIDTCLVNGGPGNTLTLSNSPNALFGYPMIAAAQGSVTNPPGANGELCVGPSGVGRYNQDLQSTGGSGGYTVDIYNSITGGGGGGIPGSAGGGALIPGDTWNFQCWNRVSGGSTFSAALTVTFQ